MQAQMGRRSKSAAPGGRIIRRTISRSSQAARYLVPRMTGLLQEEVRVLLLTSRNALVADELVYRGTCQSVQMRPAEVLRPAIIAGVPKILLAHNHPGGDCRPSGPDEAATREMQAAAEMMGIDLLDHLVIGGDGEYASIFLRLGLTSGMHPTVGLDSE